MKLYSIWYNYTFFIFYYIKSDIKTRWVNISVNLKPTGEIKEKYIYSILNCI